MSGEKSGIQSVANLHTSLSIPIRFLYNKYWEFLKHCFYDPSCSLELGGHMGHVAQAQSVGTE